MVAGGMIETGAGQQPQRRMSASEHIRQQLVLAPIWTIGALLLYRLHGRLVVQNRMQLVHHDGRNEQAEQRRHQHKDNRVNPATEGYKLYMTHNTL